MVPSPLLVWSTGLSLALAALGCLAVRLPVAPLGATGVLVVSAALFVAARYYRTKRAEPRIADSLAGTGFIILFTAACGVLSYVTASLNLPLRDEALAKIDAALGFDWLAMLGYVNDRPWLAKLLVYAYHSEIYQVPLVVIVLGMTGRAVALDRFLCVYLLSALAIVLVAGVLPALGPFVHYHPDPALHTQFTAEAGRWHLAQVLALREGTLGTLHIERIEGLVVFPSFHTALAVNLIVALWTVPWLRWPGLILNLLVILGTVPEGGHYFTDVIVGGAIAVAALFGHAAWHARADGRKEARASAPKGLPAPAE